MGGPLGGRQGGKGEGAWFPSRPTHNKKASPPPKGVSGHSLGAGPSRAKKESGCPLSVVIMLAAIGTPSWLAYEGIKAIIS